MSLCIRLRRVLLHRRLHLHVPVRLEPGALLALAQPFALGRDLPVVRVETQRVDRRAPDAAARALQAIYSAKKDLTANGNLKLILAVLAADLCKTEPQ